MRPVLITPTPTAFDLRFSLLGIPVRVHPLFWIVTIFMNRNLSPAFLLIWVAVVFVSIVVHEFGHALMARWIGWRPLEVILYGLGGLAVSDPTYRNPYASMGVALAGPVAGFVLAGIVLLGLGYAPQFSWGEVGPEQTLPLMSTPLFTISTAQFFDSEPQWFLFHSLLFVNIFWGLINLLPVYPLDGGQICREWMVMQDRREGVSRALWISIVAAGAVAILALTKNQTYLGIMFAILSINCFMMLNTPYQGYGRDW